MDNEKYRKIDIIGYHKYVDKDTKENMIRVITKNAIDDIEGYGEDVKLLYFNYDIDLEKKLKDYIDKKLFNAKVEVKENFATGRIKIVNIIIN